ncbi:MAG TPA: alkaline phosphatase family protein [Candidatus Bathyarchaeia archaeon]|nr:alkaline phosphatase family protein [Candidatus Bathyarchaeia archaeon]
MMRLKFFFPWLVCLFFYVKITGDQGPRLTVIIVVDQCAYRYMQLYGPYFKWGLRKLLEQGVCYADAYFPHAMPATGTGHTALATGTYATDHGIVGNGWLTRQGVSVACDQDDRPEAAVFDPNGGIYDEGKSPHYIKMPGISDSFVLHARPGRACHAYSVSGKSRAAICTATNLGKAIWFDTRSGMFTSSKAYFDELPEWLCDFNEQHCSSWPITLLWAPVYDLEKQAYSFYHTYNYTATRISSSFVGSLIPLTGKNQKTPFSVFEKTPMASELLVKLAKTCIKEHIERHSDDRLLLWVCISNLDKIGHSVGPNSIEVIDTLYHLDYQINDLMLYAQKKAGRKSTCFVLTADHGMAPIPELAHEEGIKTAQRVDKKEFMEDINDMLEEKFGIADCVKHCKMPSIYFNPAAFIGRSRQEIATIIYATKQYLMAKPYVKMVWTYEELRHLPFVPGQIEYYYKQQLFPGRTGDLIVQVYPYVIVTRYKVGDSHKTPYECDTHVPLIVYYPGHFERKLITQRVITLQLANTLAHILRIPHPQGSTCEVLPGLFDPEIPWL